MVSCLLICWQWDDGEMNDSVERQNAIEEMILSKVMRGRYIHVTEHRGGHCKPH